MKSIKRAFTLVELTITMIIISLLIGIMFQVYIVISHIAVKIQGEKMLHHELIYAMQTIQNIVDAGDMELVGYDASQIGEVKEVLTLSGSVDNYKIQIEDEKLELIETNTLGTDIYFLTDDSKVRIKQFYIKVFPHKDGASIENIVHDGFWLFLKAEIPNYNENKWWYRIKTETQTFFNIRKYD